MRSLGFICNFNLLFRMTGDWINTLIQNCVLPWLRLNVTAQEMLACRYIISHLCFT